MEEEELGDKIDEKNDLTKREKKKKHLGVLSKTR